MPEQINFLKDLAEFSFLRNAVLAALLSALPAGIIGTQTLVRRSAYLVGAVSHCVLAGIGIAVFLNMRLGWSYLTPQLGALIAAVVSALCVCGRGDGSSSGRRDATASAMWALGMAVGVSFLAMTPGYQTGISDYLFGSIMMVGNRELGVAGLLGVLILIVTVLCHNRFLAIGFDRQGAELRAVNVALYERIFFVLAALAIVMLVQTVGVMLAIALLTLPAATAGLFTRRLSRMMIVAVLLSAAVSFFGIWASYTHDLPVGATIVELAAAVYVTARLYVFIRARRFFL